MLCDAHCTTIIIQHTLHDVHCTLCNIGGIVYCMSYTARHTIYDVQCTSCIVYHLNHTVYRDCGIISRTAYTVWCTFRYKYRIVSIQYHTPHCTLYTAHSVHYTVYTIQCTVHAYPCCIFNYWTRGR